MRPVPVLVLDRLPRHEGLRLDRAPGEVGVGQVEPGVEHRDLHPRTGVRRRRDAGRLEPPRELLGVGEGLGHHGPRRGRRAGRLAPEAVREVDDRVLVAAEVVGSGGCQHVVHELGLHDEDPPVRGLGSLQPARVGRVHRHDGDAQVGDQRRVRGVELAEVTRRRVGEVLRGRDVADTGERTQDALGTGAVGAPVLLREDHDEAARRLGHPDDALLARTDPGV